MYLKAGNKAAWSAADGARCVSGERERGWVRERGRERRRKGKKGA